MILAESYLEEKNYMVDNLNLHPAIQLSLHFYENHEKAGQDQYLAGLPFKKDIYSS